MSTLFIVSIIFLALGLSACISATVIHTWSWRYLRQGNLGEGLLNQQVDGLTRAAPVREMNNLQNYNVNYETPQRREDRSGLVEGGENTV